MPMMPPDRICALVVIDLQEMLRALPLVHPFSDVVERSRGLTEAFRASGQPVVLVNTDGSAPGRTSAKALDAAVSANWTDLVPELAARPGDIRVTKRTWSAFPGTALEERLRSLEVTQVAIAGIATSMGVESSAREAHGLGFNVVLAVDAMTDLSAEAHANSVSRVFPNLGETASVAEITAALRPRQN